MNSTANKVGAVFSTMTGSTVESSAGLGQGRNQNSNKMQNENALAFDNILSQISFSAVNSTSQSISFVSAQSAKTTFATTVSTVLKNDTASQTRKSSDNLDDRNTQNKIKNDRSDDKDTVKAEKAEDKNPPVKEDKIKNNTGKTQEADEPTQKKIDEKGKELIKDISEKLNLSEEEIVNVMQSLGFTAADLFDPQNLQEVVTNLSGLESAVDLVTDSDTYMLLQDLIEDADNMKSELMNEPLLSEEEFADAVEPETGDFKEYLSKGIDKEMLKDIPGKDPKPEDMEVRANNQDLKDALLSDKTSDKRISGSDGTSEKIVIEDERPAEGVMQLSNTGADNGQNFDQNASSNLFNQITQNIAEAMESAPASSISYTDRAQMENIIKQITEKITISASEDKTQMELQLHPASLGNVNILLSSQNDGGIIARFTAQNEIVKEAVESQMLQLQQKFEEQGIKVTSIEVTVSSHAFEQNLQQDQNQDGQREAFQKSRSRQRRINLQEIDSEIAKEMTEEDLLAAKVMEMNGGTVDYSA